MARKKQIKPAAEGAQVKQNRLDRVAPLAKNIVNSECSELTLDVTMDSVMGVQIDQPLHGEKYIK